jgi:hypothetical protein
MPEWNKNANNQGIITSSTPTTGAIGPTGATGPEYTVASRSQLAQNYGNLSDSARLDLAQRLKKAGYKIPVTGKYNAKVREAFLSASEDLNKEVEYLALNDPTQLTKRKIDLTSFLEEKSTSITDKAPSVVRRKTEYRPETIDAVVQAAFQDLTGRGASEEELKKYRDMAFAQLGKKSAMGQTTYTNVGGGVQEQITKEAFDPKQFLYSKIAGTDEARATKIFSFYDAFKKALGV